MQFNKIGWENNRNNEPGLGSVPTTVDKFENVVLFLRLGLPSTLIRHKNETFRKRSSNRNLRTPSLRFRVDGKHLENRAFRKWRHDIHVISLTEFSSKTNSKSVVIVALSRFSGVVWTEKMWHVFREKASLHVAVPSHSRFSSGGGYGYKSARRNSSALVGTRIWNKRCACIHQHGANEILGFKEVRGFGI